MRCFQLRSPALAVVFALLAATASIQFAAAQTAPDRNSPVGDRSRGAAVPYPALTWRFETGSQISDTPVLAGTTLLVHSEDGYLYALDEVTGEQRWRLETGHGPFSRATFAAAGDAVYVSDTTGRLLAVDLETGEERWSRTAQTSPESAVFSAPTVIDGVVYIDDVAEDHGTVYALDAAAGEPIWETEVGRMPGYPLPVVDGTVVVSDIDGGVWLVDAESGALRASHDTGGSIPSAPLVVEGAAYLGVGTDRVDAFDLDSAELRWSTALPVEPDSTVSVWDIAGDVLVASSGDRLFGIGVADGEVLWEFTAVSFASPTIDGDTVFTLDPELHLTALGVADGNVRWTIGDRVDDLTVVDETVYANVGQSVYALDRNTGRASWRVRTGGIVHAPVLVAKDRIYTGSGDHWLYVFALDDAIEPPDGFSFAPGGFTDESLVDDRIEALPDAPAFTGLWRAALEPGEEGVLPAFAGPAVAVVSGGALTSPDPLLVGLGFEITIEETAVEDGGHFFVPAGEQVTIVNSGDTAVELLIIGVLPADAERPDASRDEIALDLLGGADVALLPGDGAFVELRRVALESGASLPPTLSVWPELLVVEDGSIEVAVAGEGAETYETGEGVAPAAAITTFVRAGAGDPATVLLLEIDGNIHIGQGAGCGSRCLSPRVS